MPSGCAPTGPGALRGLVEAGQYDDTVREELPALLESGSDSDPATVERPPLAGRLPTAGRTALAGYLGTPAEIDFDEVNAILAAFHAGADHLMLKRMGREPGQVWYDSVDVSDVRVLVIEWTHGNNVNVEGVDIAILLNSTPEETLAHRRARARDGAVDSPFTSTVLQLEQAKLHAQAHRAKIIVNKTGELIDHDTYLRSMGKHLPEAGAMLNVYPDSIGGTLRDLVEFVTEPRSPAPSPLPTCSRASSTPTSTAASP